MKLTGETTVVGVFGDPVAHSLSPLMHNRAFAELGLNWVYVPFHVKPDALGGAVNGVRALGLAGVNVTVPHKVAVMAHLDEIDEEAQAIGAVNTIVNKAGRLVGYNTDGRGFLRSMERQSGRTVEGARVVVIGAGGAAQAILCSLAHKGAASIAVANRTIEKARRLVGTLAKVFGQEARSMEHGSSDERKALSEADIVIHTTTVGMHPRHDEAPPISVDVLRPETLVCDIVYNPRETALIRAARSRGCDVLTGEGMLVYQGAVAFELWTGTTAPDELMLTTLRAALDQRS